MLITASLTLLSLLGSVVLTLSGKGSPLATAHLAFAAGIVPLIMAAMIHFVPVLTRSGDPDRRILAVPHVAQAAGLCIALAMQGVLPYLGLYGFALLDAALVVILLFWISGRTRHSLGAPHPCARWYVAALLCLLLALGAVLLQSVWSSQWRALRLVHLHLNTLGLVGMAALGTLSVLMPTVLGKPDPDAASWLRRRLWLVAGGVFLVAFGAALAWPLAAAGAALLLVAMFGLLGQWSRRFSLAAMLSDGAAAALLVALFGFLGGMFYGVVHGAGLLPAQPAVFAWASACLLPLVTGALSQLLPVWRWPGPLTPARNLMRQKLTANGRLRAGLFLLAGLCLYDQAWWAGGLLTVTGMLLFLIDFVLAMRVRRSTR